MKKILTAICIFVLTFTALSATVFAERKRELPVYMESTGSSGTKSYKLTFEEFEVSNVEHFPESKVNALGLNYSFTEITDNARYYINVKCYDKNSIHIATVPFMTNSFLPGYLIVPENTAKIELCMKNPASQSDSYYYSRYMDVYSADGRTKTISKLLLPIYKKVGWFEKAPSAPKKTASSLKRDENMTLRVAGYRLFSDDPLNYEFALGANKFTEKYGAKVEFLVGGGDGLGEDLVAGIVSGDPWEVQHCFGISVFPLTFAEGLYTPIDSYIDFESNQKIDKITVDGTKWLGEYYGISNLPMQEMWYLAYNETWMKELGLKTPYEYYKEGNWTLDSYKKLNAKATASGAKSRSSVTRPHTGSRYMSKWNESTGEVKVTYDSPENIKWLSFWGSLLTDPKYNIVGGGFVSQRNVIMRDEVMPNLMKDELTQKTTDVIRYIHFPNPDGGLGTYLTDSHFLFPLGIPEKKLPYAVKLASYMSYEKGKSNMDLYSANMLSNDVELFKKNMDKAYFLPRIFYKGAFAIGNTFRKDMAAGKSISTHISENTESLKARAAEFNEKYAY